MYNEDIKWDEKVKFAAGCTIFIIDPFPFSQVESR